MESSKSLALKCVLNLYATDRQMLDRYFDKISQAASNDLEDDFEKIDQCYREYDKHLEELDQVYSIKIEQLFDNDCQTVLNAVG